MQNLRRAEQQQDWKAAYAILLALGEIYERQSRRSEFKTLQQRALKQVGISLTEAKAKGQSAFEFWIYLRNEDFKEAIKDANLAKASEIGQEILNELRGLNDPLMNDALVCVYQNLGIVAQRQGNFEGATTYYEEVRQFRQDEQDSYEATTIYHQLGNLALQQGNFEEAVNYHQSSSKTREFYKDFYRAANNYYQLSIAFQQQGKLEDAIENCKKALLIWEKAQNFEKTAYAHHQLGVLSQKQEKLEDAVQNYKQAIPFFEDNNYLNEAANIYHNLQRISA